MVISITHSLQRVLFVPGYHDAYADLSFAVGSFKLRPARCEAGGTKNEYLKWKVDARIDGTLVTPRDRDHNHDLVFDFFRSQNC